MRQIPNQETYPVDSDRQKAESQEDEEYLSAAPGWSEVPTMPILCYAALAWTSIDHDVH